MHALTVTEKEIRVSMEQGIYTFKLPSSAEKGELSDWTVKMQLVCQDVAEITARGEDHLFGVKSSDASEKLLAGEEKQKQVFLTRQKLVSEIIAKEEEYVTKLGRIASVRTSPLVLDPVSISCCLTGPFVVNEQLIQRLRTLGNKELITSDEIVQCFSCIEVLHQAHSDMLAAMHERMAGWDANPCIGDVLLPKVEGVFGKYRPYILAHPSLAGNLSSVLFKKPLLVITINEWEKKDNDGGKIEHVLDLPTRRAESLHSQIIELIRNTPDEHADYKSLVRVAKGSSFQFPLSFACFQTPLCLPSWLF
jgi:hypothetical protein